MVSGPWSMIRCLIEAWRLGVTDRQDDQSASHAALDFIRSREVDRFADYMRRGLSAARISKPKFRVLAELGHSIFQIRTERFILGVLGLLRIRRSYLRKPSHRPVYILPNARREVSSGLRCPRTEAVLLGHSRQGNRTVCLELMLKPKRLPLSRN
jgi:hypothetical protein